MNIFKKIKNIFTNTAAKQFVIAYAMFTLMGSLLLMAPFSLKEGKSIKFVDALFTAVSGISTTGLSTISVNETFTTTGKIVLAFILQFGGIGLIMLFGLIWFVRGKKIGIKEQTMIMQDQNQVGGTHKAGKLVMDALKVLFFVEFVMFVIMSHYLYFSGYFGYQESLFQAFFMTISMITNAGFDISPTGASLSMYANDYIFQVIAMFLMFTGAVGFWPLIEIKDWFLTRFNKNKETHKFTVFTKIIVKFHIALWVIGAIAIFVIESLSGGYFATNAIDLIDKVFYSIFQSITTRNAGFATMDVSQYKDVTLFIFVILMYIGSSPNSAGGGIRTTTLLVTLLAMYNYAIDRKQVIYKHKALKEDAVHRSFLVAFGGIMIISASTMMLLITDGVTLKEGLFEVASAFGTTGLSLGITGSLTTLGKVNLIAVMFIGRVGILAFLLLLKSHRDKNVVKYPYMDLIVG